MSDYSPSRTSDRPPVERTAITPAEDARTIALNRISWGAVLAGVVLALVVQLLLNLLGIGIGVATLDPGSADNPAARTFSIAAGIWYVVAGIIAAFVGGYFASRLSGRSLKTVGALHGVTTWAVTTLVVLYLLTTAVGSLLGGVFSTVSSAVGGLGRATATVAETAAPALTEVADPFGTIQRQIEGTVGGNDPRAMRDAAVAAVRAAFTGDQAQAEQARERAAQVLAQAQSIPIEQARTQIQQYEQQYRAAVDQAQQRATQAAEAATKVVSRGALFGFIALVLGAIAAWFGGSFGTVAPLATTGSVAYRS
ncbi:MAG TPA: PhnA-like protein [Rhizobiaceae bacterium]|nr:PhnA-like protein [Rhizobiaceae bacterium]